MPAIIHTATTTHHVPRPDNLAREQEWTLSDGRQVRLRTYKDGGTRTLAHVRHVDPSSAARPPISQWTHITVAHARRILKTAQDLPQLP